MSFGVVQFLVEECVIGPFDDDVVLLASPFASLEHSLGVVLVADVSHSSNYI
jgi:hypothetical protein